MMKPKNPFERFAGWINRRREIEQTTKAMRALRIKGRGSEVSASTLSGGNQQKLALAKWVFSDCEVLMLMSQREGWMLVPRWKSTRSSTRLAERGVAVIVVSSELPELVGLCDRIIVVREGRIVGEVAGAAIRREIPDRSRDGVRQ